MKSAFRLYTWRGMNVDRIDAKAVKSHAAATEFGPFTDDEQRPVHWVGWGTRENGRKIPPYFRHWPKNGRDRHLFRTLAEEMALRDAACGESQVHKKAKTVAVDLLNRMIRESKPIPWIFSNPEVSDFPLSGDLLSEVTEAKAEYGVISQLEGWIKALEAKGFTAGLVLFCLGGVGRGVSFAIKPASESWIYHISERTNKT